MNDEQILAVSVEARINKLEKEMRRAAAITGKNFDAMEQRSKRAASDIEKHFAGLSTRIGGMGKAMVAGFVGGIVAGGIDGVAQRFADVAHAIADIGDKAQQAGMDVKAFQELAAVARANRLEVDDLSAAMRELQLRADEWIASGGKTGSAAEAFARIGYSVDALSGKLDDPSALLTEIIGKVQHLDRAAQIRVFDELFGGDGERLIRLLGEGEDGVRRIIEQARLGGRVFDEQLVRRAQELDAAIAGAADTVATRLQGAIADAGWQLYNFVQQFWAFEQRTTESLDQSIRDLGLERRDLENEILQIQSDQAQVGNLNAAISESRITDARTRLEQIAAQERQILELLERRKPPTITAPKMDMPGAGATWTGFGDEFAPPEPRDTRGGSGASSAREQADATEEVIAALREELALLGQTEVEQRIAAELRRAGANATDQQKQSIRELALAIETEAGAMDQLQAALDSAKGIAKDFLGGLLGDLRSGVDGATALANAFGRLGDKLLDMALDTAIEALFGNLIGGAAGGGVLKFLGFSQGGVVEAATGGRIRGPGTGTSDSIPARLSDGEFVVRASQTAKHLDLLHAINDGKLPAFATGGLVGDGPAIRAANDNVRVANDNAAPVISISAPVTVNANGGTPGQNRDLAERTAKQLEGTLRSLVTSEIQMAMRPGNLLNSRSR